MSNKGKTEESLSLLFSESISIRKNASTTKITKVNFLFVSQNYNFPYFLSHLFFYITGNCIICNAKRRFKKKTKKKN